MRRRSSITDFFVICTGNSTRQIKTLADYIFDKLKQIGQRPGHVEGYHYASWVLVDCFGVILHVFMPQARQFYDLERLWAELPRMKIKDHEQG